MSATRETIEILARQAARWSTAARQDANPFIANLHGGYGAAYVFALRQVASDEEIRRATGLDAIAFEREIVAIQDVAARRLLRVAPQLAPRNSLARTAGERALGGVASGGAALSRPWKWLLGGALVGSLVLGTAMLLGRGR